MAARLLAAIVVLLVLAAVGFLTVAMPFMDRRSNRVVRSSEWPVSDEARSLHRSLTVADLHADALLWPRSIATLGAVGHVDVPRLVRGGVALQVFSVVTQSPRGLNYVRNDSTSDMIALLAVSSRWPVRTWRSRVERALHQAARFDQAVRQSNGRLVPVRSTADLSRLLARRAREPELVGGVLALEGAHAADGTMANLERLYAAGYRMIGLTHFFDNDLGGSSAGVAQGGLTAFGRDAVRWMEERRVIVDLAHASAALIDDVLAMARRPVVVSHTGVQGTCPGPRNLTDDQVARIAGAGGVIGIGYWDAAVCGTAPDSVARAILHAIAVAGPAHVALGSDFDGSITTAFDTSELVVVTDALLRAGLDRATIRQVMGENLLRFLMANLPPR